MLSSLLKPDNIVLSLQSSDKDELFAEMLEVLVRADSSINRSEAMKALTLREERQNTCVMPGVAVPHASLPSIHQPLVAIGLSEGGIDYEIESAAFGPCSSPLVHLVIMILFEPGNTERHLHVLSDVASVLNADGFLNDVLTCRDKQSFIQLVRNIETEL